MGEEKQTRITSFNSYFQRCLRPELERFERIRKLRLPFCILLIALGVSGFFTLLLYYIAPESNAPAIPFYTFLLLAMIAFLYRYAILPMLHKRNLIGNYSGLIFGNEDRRLEYSQNVLTRVAAFAKPGLRWGAAERIHQGDFMESDLTNNFFNTYKGRDLFIGQHGRVRMAFSWLRVEYIKKDKNDNNPSQLLFNGWFFVLRFPRRFFGRTIIYPDIAEAAMGWFGRSVQGFTVPPGFELVHLEDVDFEKFFMVHSEGQLEARYVVRPSFMRAASAARKRVKGPVAMSFRHECMFLAFPSITEHFTFLPTRQFTDPTFTKHFYQAIKSVCELAEDIQANQIIWRDSMNTL